LSFIEFAYNRSVFSTTKFFSFKIMYGCNSLTLLNLLFLYIDERVSFERIIKDLHTKIQVFLKILSGFL